MKIIVTLKQVVDPLTPVSALKVDGARRKILGPPDTPPVINGYDEQALEAALRIKEEWRDGECQVIALSAGTGFDLDVMKRAFAAGADELVLIEDTALDTWDVSFIVRTLAAAIKQLGGADLVLCGRQASDWDNAQAPLMLAELLGLPCLTLARRVEVKGQHVQVERVLSDGIQVMEANLPAVVTVTSELGELRYPPMRARLQAAKRRPRTMTLKELGVTATPPAAVEMLDLSLLQIERDCQFVKGASEAEAGRMLAELLIGGGFIKPQQA
ncbi:MAG: electron transfer flavoprotein subunit beta/FixA family protein [Chloroflexi bacterium]|nr:electron transfer flavoprotein subunit beta/FixA family protein [Chloroflexota bacterium]